MNMKSTLIAAAASGILMGVVACGNSAQQGAQDPSASSAKHSCKGQNACKGQGGCKTESHSCKGQNACKGQGGCKG